MIKLGLFQGWKDSSVTQTNQYDQLRINPRGSHMSYKTETEVLFSEIQYEYH